MATFTHLRGGDKDGDIDRCIVRPDATVFMPKAIFFDRPSGFQVYEPTEHEQKYYEKHEGRVFYYDFKGYEDLTNPGGPVLPEPPDPSLLTPPPPPTEEDLLARQRQRERDRSRRSAKQPEARWPYTHSTPGS